MKKKKVKFLSKINKNGIFSLMPSRSRQKRICRLLGILFLSSLTLCLWLGQIPSTEWQAGLGKVATAQSPKQSQLVRQGVEQYESGDYRSAIESWQQALTTYQNTNNLADTAIVLENLARAYQQIGQIHQAIGYWEQVIASDRQLGDLQRVGRMLTEQAQAYSLIGQQRQAIALLCGTSEPESACHPGSALQIARELNDSQGEAAALGSLGEAYRLAGNYDQAIQSLEKAKKIGHPAYQVSVFNSLGNAYFSRAQLWNRRANSALVRGATEKADEFQAKATENSQQALAHYQNSLELAQTQNDRLGQMRVLLNLIRLDSQFPESRLADGAVERALALLKDLPNSPTKVYAAIDLANLSVPAVEFTSPLTQCPPTRRLPNSEAEGLLRQAVNIAQNLQDSRAESFSLGALGHFYECRQDYEPALELTQKALWASDQNLVAEDSLYLWEWQAGRIFQERGRASEAFGEAVPKALAAYERAYTILEKIRSDILIANRDVQFDFRDIIEPLYRQLAQLKLELASRSPIDFEKQERELTGALRTIDSLKLAELQNYFGDDCVLTATDEQSERERVEQNPDRKIIAQLQKIGKDAAVFIPIVLKDRTAIVVSLPNGEQRLKWIEVKKETLKQEIEDFRLKLQEFYDPTQAFLTPAQNLYHRLISPFASDLESAQIETLVFIQDSFFRSVPMAALHDGQEFLVQKYAIATTPSLTLTAPQVPNRKGLRALAVGLTQRATVDGETYPALLNVSNEIAQVRATFPDSKQLLNDQFTRESLQQELEQAVYPIIHLATHGQFGTISEDTFLVTGKNKKLTLTDLETDIRRFSRSAEPLELLALTACQTAVGDDRTTLGLAGITVQAGVRSALASLWFISDVYTEELVTQFYGDLKLGMNKAKALQEAQKTMIEKGSHPARWAPFILIGNWL
jgi:CHAT domain-containing protein